MSSFVSQESNASQGLSFSVDKYGFFLAWREDDKVGQLIVCSLATAVLKIPRAGLARNDCFAWRATQCFGKSLLVSSKYLRFLPDTLVTSASFLNTIGSKLSRSMLCQRSQTRRCSEGRYLFLTSFKYCFVGTLE